MVQKQGGFNQSASKSNHNKRYNGNFNYKKIK